MIRVLAAADAPVYAAIRRRMLLDTPPAFGSSPETDRVNDLEAFTRQLETASGFAIVGAFDEDAGLVSVAGLNREGQPKRRHIVTVWGVFTLPAARRRGLCRGVLEHAITLARTWKGVESLQLSVSEAAPGAQALYESLGFTRWGVEPDALRVEGRSYRELHMHLAL